MREMDTVPDTCTTAERKAVVRKGLERLRAELLITHPFFAHLALQLDLKPLFDCRVSTAATDGTTVYFSVPFFESIPQHYRQFVMIHEIMHCVLGHHRREMGRNPRVWNIAADHEINYALVQEGFQCPRDAVLFEAFEGQSAEYIYDRIKSRALFDDRMQIFYFKGIPAPTGVFDPDYPLQSKLVEAEVLGHILLRAQTMSSTSFGDLPGCCQKSVNILSRPTKLPWRNILQEFVTRQLKTRLDWNRPQRRLIHQKLYLPSRRSEGVSLLVAIDVSGSVYQQCGAFLSELKQILSAFPGTSCELVVFDTEIRSRQTISVEDLDDARQFHISGGGGTDFQPVIDLLHASYGECGATPDVAIILTDGYANPPTRPPAECAVLWALTEDGRLPVDWGTTVTLDF